MGRVQGSARKLIALGGLLTNVPRHFKEGDEAALACGKMLLSQPLGRWTFIEKSVTAVTRK